MRLIVIIAAVIAAAGAGYYYFQGRGSDQPAFVGMQIQGVNDDIAKALGMPEAKGVLVRDVAVGGPSDWAGVKRGDLIVSFDGTPVTTFEELLSLVAKTRAERRVPIALLRGGEEVTLSLKTGEWPVSWRINTPSTVDVSEAGLTLMALTEQVRARFNLPWGAVGVVVAKVDPKSRSKTDVQIGEVIVQVNQTQVWLPAHVVREARVAKGSGRDKMLLLVQGLGGFRFSLLPIE